MSDLFLGIIYFILFYFFFFGGGGRGEIRDTCIIIRYNNNIWI